MKIKFARTICILPVIFLAGIFVFGALGSAPAVKAADPTDAADFGVWHFDENSGTVAYDSGPNGNNLEWGHNPWGGGKIAPERVRGQWDLGINFSQTEELYSRQFSPAVSWPDGLTVGIWIKTDVDTPQYTRFFWLGNTFDSSGSPANHFMLAIKDGHAVIKFKKENEWQEELVSEALVNDSNWHFIAVSLTASGQAKLYIDGIKDGELSFAQTIPAAENIVIGRREDYYAPYALNNFKGVIDDVWIRSESLDDSKILEIFQSAKPYKSEITETALAPIAVKAIYHFDDTGDTASDSSGNGYNLSWGANPWGGGEPSPRRVSGRFDKAINFNKVEDLFSRNVDPPVNFENGISAGAWIKTGAQSDPGARFLVLGGNNKENNIVLSEKLGQAFLTVNFSDGCTATTNGPACFYRTYNITSSQSINDNNWHFISFTFDPRAHNHTLKLYIDGEEEGSEFIPGNPPSFGQVKVGYREDNSCGRFCNFMGDVDDLFILSSILSPEEVKQIYESGQPFAWPLVKEKDPVIIVPGILGSWQSLNIKLIDPILHTYDNLIEALIQSGYELDKNLFVFPYNWRQNNVTTAGQLKDKIQEIKEITGKTKVDIVAHSMGGLVARYYVQSSEYQNDVDQLIFLGTPHKGAPEDYLAWEGSYFLANNWLLNSVLGLEAAEHKYLNIIKYIHEQAPSVEQLLPTYNYLQNKLGDSWIDRIYPVQYPRNEFLENLNTQAGISALKGRANIINIFSHSLKANTTVSKIRVISDPDIYDSKWMDGYPENLDDGNADCLILGDGDRTVPNESSNSLAGVKTIELSGYDHRQMVTAAQKEVIKELTGKTPDKYIDSLWSAIKRIFFIRVYSPVDFTIIAPDGKRLGKDFFSNTDLNEIDGAFYSGFGAEEEFATILEPMDGEYKIEIQGVSRGGQYQLGTSLINTDNESEIEKNYQGNIAENQVQEFRINYSSTSDNPLSDPEPIDLVAPTINITSPAEGSNYLHNATMQIEYSATDDFSGISATSTLLDGQSVDNEKADLFFLKTGEHLLEFRALDKAGNMATSTVKFNITATPDSVISDIQRLYNLRWIYDRITSKLLITEIEEIKWRLKLLNEAKNIIIRTRGKIEANNSIPAKTKVKMFQRYNEELERLDKENDKKLKVVFDRMEKSLWKYLTRHLINQKAYDIIKDDFNYLKNNL